MTGDVEIALRRLRWGSTTSTMIGEILAILQPALDDVRPSPHIPGDRASTLRLCREEERDGEV